MTTIRPQCEVYHGPEHACITAEEIKELEGGGVVDDLVVPAEATPSCLTCDEDCDDDVCVKSQRTCGHHCNHWWTHDVCCWCGKELDVDEES